MAAVDARDDGANAGDNAPRAFFLQLAGFVVLIFGLLKLVEVAIIGQKASPQKS